MDTIQTDWIVVVVAAVLNSLIGLAWYSKWCFGPTWAKMHGLKEKETKFTMQRIFMGFIVSLVIAYFISFFQGHLGITNVSDGMFAGFLLWLGFVATTQIASVVWRNQPLKLFAIHSGYKLLTFLVMSGIIGA